VARQRGYNDCEPKLNSPTFGRGRRDTNLDLEPANGAVELKGTSC